MSASLYNGIVVKNIYYMLTYAFEVLQEREYADLATEEFDHIDDLLAAILILGLSGQIKRGLNHEYIQKNDTLSILRGKIDLSTSIRTQSLLRRQVVCQFDEFSEDNLINRILKTASWQLVRSSDVVLKKRHKLKKLLRYFENTQLLEHVRISWNSLRFHHNNASYQMLMTICRLILERRILSNEHGSAHLRKYEDDKKLCRLYERFVLKYFQKHYPQYKASPIRITWNLDNGFSNYLPAMKTDITLRSEEKTLIIDTKWYSKTMQYHEQWHSIKCHSANLYQIYTYVKNYDRDRSGNVSGLLLYAKTDELFTPDFDYQIDGNAIGIKTLDLSGNWDLIETQLKKIIISWKT